MFSALYADIALLVLAFVIGAVGLFSRPGSTWAGHIAWSGLLGLLLLLFALPPPEPHTWMGAWQIDGLRLLLRQIFIFSALLATLLSRSYFRRGGDGLPALRNESEFLAILCLVTFGAITLVSATDLLSLFVGLELATVPLYFLTAWNKADERASEAATKFILMGTAATSVMLFGFSYLFGFAGSLQLQEIARQVAATPQSPMLWFAVLFLLGGIGFKLTLFPFHMWAPDVYEGAPTPITAFLSVSSKAAAIAFLMMLIYGPLAPIHADLQWPLLLLAGTTMTVGNLGALRQNRLRRFMAWSSIAQAGYILTALTGPSLPGQSSVIFYLFLYAASNYLLFFIIGILGGQRPESMDSLRGLSRQHPGLAAILAICAFSLAGIPPMAGFLGKFLLFSSNAAAGHYAFLVFAGLNSTISLYYYLQLLRRAWVDGASEHPPLAISTAERWSIAMLTLIVLLGGLVPQLNTYIYQLLS